MFLKRRRTVVVLLAFLLIATVAGGAIVWYRNLFPLARLLVDQWSNNTHAPDHEIQIRPMPPVVGDFGELQQIMVYDVNFRAYQSADRRKTLTFSYRKNKSVHYLSIEPPPEVGYGEQAVSLDRLTPFLVKPGQSVRLILSYVGKQGDTSNARLVEFRRQTVLNEEKQENIQEKIGRFGDSPVSSLDIVKRLDRATPQFFRDEIQLSNIFPVSDGL